LDTKIVKIQALPELKRKTRVAAYARVSSGKDAMLHSLSYQVSYYSNMIQVRDGWEFVGVYADEAISGTKANRENFNRMIDDCKAHKIDLILTKSISRFARNTIVLLETVRELKQLGIDVFFEEQNIHALSGDGELMISILAGFAQEEAKSVSENMKWRIKKNFEEGKAWSVTFLGYRLKGGKLVIEPTEAETIRLIFSLFLDGLGIQKIAQRMTDLGRKTRFENTVWAKSSINTILNNGMYTGDLLLQKTYRKNYLDKHSYKNNGILPQYLVENSHEAIVSKETFILAQKELKRRAEIFKNLPSRQSDGNQFKGKVRCATCGWSYIRKKTHGKSVWGCTRYLSKGKSYCSSKNVPEEAILDGFNEIFQTEGFDKTIFKAKVKQIMVHQDNLLVFELTDGTKHEFRWSYKSRSLSWTDDMKEKARKRSTKKKEEKLCQK
jgi:DNA invertase Pin-like site-specific DNA recombinase